MDPSGSAPPSPHPSAIRAWCWATPGAWPVNGDLHFEVFSRLMGGLVGRLLTRRFNLFVNVMIPAGHRRRTLTTAEMNHYRLPFPTPERRNPTAVFPKDITGARSFLSDLERGLVESLADLPTLFVWADADIAFRTRELHHWETLMRRHQTVVLPGAGHYLQSDAPTEFATVIRNCGRTDKSGWHSVEIQQVWGRNHGRPEAAATVIATPVKKASTTKRLGRDCA